MAEEKITKAAKLKKKAWIQVFAPKSFNNEILGEIPASDSKSLIGRALTINLMGLTNDIKKQNKNLKFVINNVQGSNAITELNGYYLNPTSVRRLIRRGKERIDLSFACKTSDNKNVRIKPLFIPRTKIKSSVSAALKKATIDYLTSYVAKNSFDNLIRDLINNNLQRELRDHIKKIYPIKILEISKLYIEKEKKRGEEKKVELKEPEEKKEGPEEETPEKKKEAPKESKK